MNLQEILEKRQFDGANGRVSEMLAKQSEELVVAAIIGTMDRIACEIEENGWSSKEAPLSPLDAGLQVAGSVSFQITELAIPNDDGHPRIPRPEILVLDAITNQPDIVGSDRAKIVRRYLAAMESTK